MYAIFPLSVPARVSVWRDDALAIPKSMILTQPSYETSRFDGETSRWTMPRGLPSAPVRVCAACRPEAAPIAIASECSSGMPRPRRPSACAIVRTSSPCTYSIVKNRPSSQRPMS